MQRFFIYTATVLIGIVVALGISSSLIGWQETSNSIALVIKRVSSHNDPPVRQVSKVDNQNTSILGIEDQGYNKLEIQSVPLVQFTQKAAPLNIPTQGVSPNANFLYVLPNHGGIDIWTNSAGSGLQPGSSKGYPVYAACAGIVTRVYYPNQEIEIVCDLISDDYKDSVPSLRIKTLYAHLGDAVTKEAYHNLRVGQRVTQGELIGYQGNQSSIAPWNRVTHLHFGIYDLTLGNRPTLNPEPYIGVSCTTVGQVFEVQSK